MTTRSGRVEAISGTAALVHVLLRAHDDATLVRDENDWRKMVGSLDQMVFWCGGHVLACRCQGGAMELAIEAEDVSPGNMLRYVTVPYALYFNQTRGRSGRVFNPSLTFRVLPGFRSELVLWVHRPLRGLGWTANIAYLEPGGLPWVDTRPVLDELGDGMSARRRYRERRVRGVDRALASSFCTPGAGSPYMVGDERWTNRNRLLDCDRDKVLRWLVNWVAHQEGVSATEMHGRSRARRLSKARCLVTLVAVRCAVPMCDVAEILRRNVSTLQESVERMRRREGAAFLADVQTIRDALCNAAAHGDIKRCASGSPNVGTPDDERPGGQKLGSRSEDP